MTTESRTDALACIVCGALIAAGAGAADRVLNPYADVHWDKVEYLHSFSHQHGQNPQIFWDMGYRHLPLSNYYPSKPLYPLPEAFARKYPGAVGAPNAEQHSTTDSGIHFNALGSLYTTGYGHTPGIKADTSPVEQVFGGLKVFDARHAPWLGVYRLDLEFAPKGKTEANAVVALTVEGAVQIESKTFEAVGDGLVRSRPLTAKSPKSLCLKAQSDSMRVRIDFDPAAVKITKFRLMQGTYRPWRDAFRAALDGTLKDAQGNPVEGLLYPDGGGITINHPTCGLEALLTLLDFDERVLGIEVWNQHIHFGGSMNQPDAMPFYELWDQTLRTGRRCFGFFVKDHFLYGRGRNVLLMTASPESTRQEREHDALRAYRQGRFFGLLGAMSVDASGKVVPPYDNSGFRFTRIAVRPGENGAPAGLEVAVDGADRTKRPHTQIRFVTDQGVARIENSDRALFAFPRGADGNILCRYVRVEAFAYPSTHSGGTPLTQEAVAAMSVSQIAHLRDTCGGLSPSEIYSKDLEPVGIADMLFSQPILFRR